MGSPHRLDCPFAATISSIRRALLATLRFVGQSRSKQVVVLATVWATAIATALPLAVVPAVVTLAGVGVFILVHHDITTPGA